MEQKMGETGTARNKDWGREKGRKGVRKGKKWERQEHVRNWD